MIIINEFLTGMYHYYYYYYYFYLLPHIVYTHVLHFDVVANDSASFQVADDAFHKVLVLIILGELLDIRTRR